MLKKILIVASIVMLGFAYLLYSCFIHNMGGNSKNEHNYVLVLHDGKSPDLSTQLKEHLSFGTYLSYKLFASWLIDESALKEGRYDIPNHLIQLIKNLRNGRQSVVKLVISKSRTYEIFEQKIQKSIHVSSDELKLALDSVSSMDTDSRIAMPQSFFGVIVPETHQVYWNTSASVLAKKFKSAYRQFWNGGRMQKLKQLGINKYQVMILASIVEEETSYDSDKSKIAAVYFNRYRKGMRLQADPTVIFAWQDYSIHRVLNKHLAIESPYNTYKYVGFPPAPICIPSISSIDAVLNMVPSNDLYFCADPSFNGRHLFTASYAEHLKNAHAYQAAYQLKFGK